MKRRILNWLHGHVTVLDAMVLLAVFVVLTLLVRDADAYQWRGMEWYRVPAYQSLPETWRPRMIERIKHDRALVECNGKQATGCATWSPTDPHATCLIVVAGKGRSALEIEPTMVHERAHCHGWKHP